MHDPSQPSTDFLSGFARLISPSRLRQILHCHGPAKRCDPSAHQTIRHNQQGRLPMKQRLRLPKGGGLVCCDVSLM